MAKSTIFLNIEVDDLIQVFDNPKVKENIEVIFEKILANKLRSLSSTQEEVLDFEATLKFLGVKEGTLYSWTSNKKIPHYKQGKLFFLRDELIKWIKSGKVKTQWELDEAAERFVNSRTKKF